MSSPLEAPLRNFSIPASLKAWFDQVVRARRGAAANVKARQIVNTSGKQLVDTWAFNAYDLDERLLMEHSRVSMRKLVPAVGDVLLTNYRRPMLFFVEDTTPGHHDMLMAACDPPLRTSRGGRLP